MICNQALVPFLPLLPHPHIWAGGPRKDVFGSKQAFVLYVEHGRKSIETAIKVVAQDVKPYTDIVYDATGGTRSYT